VVARWIEQQWQGSSAWQMLLIPLAGVFGMITALRRQLYQWGWMRAQRLPVPVIVVGNISVGGTGKTPLVIWLAQQLQLHGYRPGIISRGYGGSATQIPRSVHPDSSPLEVGDEPVLLARDSGCPVWVGRDRAAAGRALRVAHAAVNVLISDDGLQHYRLARDMELAVMDGARGFGNRRLLPAGPLREPLARLSRVDALVANQIDTARPADVPADLPVFFMALQATRCVNLADPSRTTDVTAFIGKRVHAVAGIGNPQRFFEQLAALGIRAETHVFPDHHAYAAQELVWPDTILMTAKDAVKCSAFATPNMWVLPVQAVLQPNLIELVLAKLGNRHG
jgi:tetraacyldisaccharide 4'-kinase